MTLTISASFTGKRMHMSFPLAISGQGPSCFPPPQLGFRALEQPRMDLYFNIQKLGPCNYSGSTKYGARVSKLCKLSQKQTQAWIIKKTRRRLSQACAPFNGYGSIVCEYFEIN
jgi:hypothetical protein